MNQTGPSYEGYEMTNPPNYSPTAGLLQDSQETRSPVQSHQNSKIRDFLRHVRLHLPSFLVGRTFSFISPDEQLKVAAYQSRSMAALNMLVHVIPLGGSAVLLFLHWTKFWAGRHGDNATTLQFVAKLHELFMQASLVDLLLYLIRAQALADFVPLGALSAAAGQQLSFLWSLDFFSAVTSPVFGTWRKIGFTLSVLGLFIMTAVVGPSSAVLMIPQPGMSYMNDTVIRHYNFSEEVLFPSRMDNSDKLDFTQFNELQNAINLGYSLGHDDRYVIKYAWRNHELNERFTYIRYFLESVSKATAGGERVDGDYYIATIPTRLSSEELLHNKKGLDPYGADKETMYWTLRIWQPVVLAACTGPYPMTGDIYYVKDDGLKESLSNVSRLFEKAEIIKTNQEIYNDDIPGYRPVWLPSPGDSPSVLGLFTKQRKDTSDELYMGVTVCTLSSFWRKSMTTMTITSLGVVVETDLPQTRDAMAKDDLRPITIVPEGMSTLLNSWLDEEKVIWENPGLLSLNFALAISKYHESAMNVSKLVSTVVPDPPLRGVDVVNETERTFFRIDEMIEGYGYGSTETFTLLSLAVIICYCAITLSYMAFLMVTGHTSTAWSSATEFVMLALQSPPADNVKNVSVGIDTMNMFRRSVGIRVRTEIDECSERVEEKLELVFADEKDVEKRALRKIVRNKAY